jgi:hypothetical protein
MPDLSLDSIAFLGRWFAAQVETRLRTPKEREDLVKHSLPGINLPVLELADRTFSLAFDVGVYFGESLRFTYRRLQWEQFLGEKLFVDYGQPILTGLGRVPLNPFRIVSTFAYGIATGEQREDRLSEVYSHWRARAAIAVAN